jgi:2-oxoisovalerate dehydrogenase E1 component alpha subunit
MSYRLGHHSTSDDSTRYRTAAEIELWREKFNPVTRFFKYLTAAGVCECV